MLVDGWMDEGGMRTNLVLEYFDYDLRQVVKNGFVCTEQHVRYIARQLFVGLAHLHSSGIIHRDIKTANILINSNDCRTVICDYNLASCADSEVNSPRTQNVVSRWYRSPELLQSCPYSEKVDIWAAGCVLCELAFSKVLWSGHSDQDQLRRICATLKPSQKDQEEIRMEPEWNFGEPDLRADHFSSDFNDFIKGVLTFSASERFSAYQALEHPWLSSLTEPRIFTSQNSMSSVITTERTVHYILASEVLSISSCTKAKP
jgi:serine/threonine protein kinase